MEEVGLRFGQRQRLVGEPMAELADWRAQLVPKRACQPRWVPLAPRPPSVREHRRRLAFERLISHAAELLDQDSPVVLAGDYNVMPTDLDVYAPERWVDDALFRPEVRDAFHRLRAQGWVDATSLGSTGCCGSAGTWR